MLNVNRSSHEKALTGNENEVKDNEKVLNHTEKCSICALMCNTSDKIIFNLEIDLLTERITSNHRDNFRI